jgi:hypothetical protein
VRMRSAEHGGWILKPGLGVDVYGTGVDAHITSMMMNGTTSTKAAFV